MGIPFVETFSSDPKPSAILFREEMDRLGLAPLANHHFLDLLDPVRGGSLCQRHSQVCIRACRRRRDMSRLIQPPLTHRPGSPAVPLPSAPRPAVPQPAMHQTAAEPGDDMSVMGFPCQPYSRQRSDRSKRPVEDHKLEQVTQKVITSLLTLKPKTFLAENVTGFADQNKGSDITPVMSFKEALISVYWVIVVEIPLSCWTEAERVRPAPHVRGTWRGALQGCTLIQT